jgi:predicted kinase
MIYIVRGLPGSGKTTLAQRLEPGAFFAADDYFTGPDGSYDFVAAKVPAAHAWVQAEVEVACRRGRNVAVHNTFTQRWEMEPYLRLAAKYGHRVVVVDCFDAGMTNEDLAEKNVHGVPVESIRAMRERYEHDWRSGNPLPPWERG